MDRPSVQPADRGARLRRRGVIAGVAAAAVLTGGVIAVLALSGRSDAAPVAGAPSTRVTPPLATESAGLTPSPSPTRTPTASAAPTATSTPAAAPVAASEPPASGWTPTEIAGLHSVTGVTEREGRLLATGQDAGFVGAMATSDDGVAWQPVSLSHLEPAAVFQAVAGEGGFVAIATRYPMPMAMGEDEYLYSTDGLTWAHAAPPLECVSTAVVAFGAGYLGLGGRCRNEGDFGPSALHVLASPDGRAWSSRIDAGMQPGPWATDGHRIVLLQGVGSGGFPGVWISDDGAATWQQVDAPFPPGVQPSGIIYGHDRYMTVGSLNSGTGDPEPLACTSADGESWQCELTPEQAGELAGRNSLGTITVTPTGYVSLVEWGNDPSLGGDGSWDMVLASSDDGLNWKFAAVPELKNRHISGIVSTSHGLFAWGGLSRNITPDEWVPYLVSHPGPLP